MNLVVAEAYQRWARGSELLPLGPVRWHRAWRKEWRGIGRGRDGPPADYKMIHGHAQLTKAQSDAVIVWFDGVTGRVATESGTRAAEVKGEQEKH